MRVLRFIIGFGCAVAIATGSSSAAEAPAGNSKCLARVQDGKASICVRKMDHDGYDFRLTGFKPRSGYRFRSPGSPVVTFRTRVDTVGSTDGVGSEMLFVNTSGPGLLADAVADHGIVITGTDKRGSRVRLTVPPHT